MIVLITNGRNDQEMDPIRFNVNSDSAPLLRLSLEFSQQTKRIGTIQTLPYQR